MTREAGAKRVRQPGGGELVMAQTVLLPLLHGALLLCCVCRAATQAGRMRIA
jgi:isoprenylcysteine carboxyl methyltransferase (ICMT) family protein YpbQ